MSTDAVVCEKHGIQDGRLVCDHMKEAAGTDAHAPLAHRFVQVQYSGSRLFHQCRICTDCIKTFGIERNKTLLLDKSYDSMAKKAPKLELVCPRCLEEYERVNVPHDFEFELTEFEQHRLFDALRTVRLGDLTDVVRQKLGKPNKEGTLYRKGKVKNPFIAHHMDYYVKIVNPTNNFNRTIILYFNIDHKLEKICYGNIEPFYGEVIDKLEHGAALWTYTRPSHVKNL